MSTAEQKKSEEVRNQKYLDAVERLEKSPFKVFVDSVKLNPSNPIIPGRKL